MKQKNNIHEQSKNISKKSTHKPIKSQKKIIYNGKERIESFFCLINRKPKDVEYLDNLRKKDIDKKEKDIELEVPSPKEPPMPKTLGMIIADAEATLLYFKECAKDKKVLDTEVTDISSSFFESKKVKNLTQNILNIPYQFSDIQGIDTVIADTNKHIQLYIPLFSKEFVGLSRDKIAVTEQVRLSDLGLPMHPMEIEVAELIERAKLGEQVFPPYNRREHENPLKYLEKYYGKYLKKFNGEEDYLYQFQIDKIDKKFRGTLATFLCRKNIDVSKYIPSKSDHLDKEVKSYEFSPLLEDKKVKKARSLHQAKYCR